MIQPFAAQFSAFSLPMFPETTGGNSDLRCSCRKAVLNPTRDENVRLFLKAPHHRNPTVSAEAHEPKEGGVSSNLL